MDVIRLKNMVFYGYHGVHESEKTLGGKFEVDLELFKDLSKAGQTDNLNDTLDYEKIYKTVNNCTKNNKYYLIEKLAERIAKSVLRKFKTDKVIVRVRKPNAPVKGVLDTVEVELIRTKESYE
jgi:dihydroneopterin aldolase